MIGIGMVSFTRKDVTPGTARAAAQIALETKCMGKSYNSVLAILEKAEKDWQKTRPSGYAQPSRVYPKGWLKFYEVKFGPVEV